MSPVQRILAASDFSNSASEAAVLAGRLARRHGAKLCLFHAQPVIEAGGDASTSVELERSLGECEHLLAELEERVAGEVGKLEVERVAITGEPVTAICNYAHTWNAQLVVVGSLGAGGATVHPEFGSVAAKVARRCECPTLISRLDQPKTVPADGDFRSPVVVIDDTSVAREAVDLAVALSLPDVTVELIHVVSIPSDAPRSVLAEARSMDLQALNELAPHVEEAAVGITFLSGSRFADELLDLVGRAADLLVVGAVAEGGPGSDYVLGSLADRLMQRSPAPLVVVNSAERK